MQPNTHLQQLDGNYLFTEIVRRTEAYRQANPDKQILRLGVGDVTRPLPQPIVEAMLRAVEEMGQTDTFRGYGLENGYAWLREAIIENDYRPRGVTLDIKEVFSSDCAGSDIGNLGELFAASNRVAIPEPAYPAYVDSSLMAGRPIEFLPCTAENGFVPSLPEQRADIIYLCYPNNPTGYVLTRGQLAEWVNYARAHQSIIIYDAAYEAFIQDPDIPHSIYEIPGAETCAIEFHSFSKTAGFTGNRCAYTVVPKALIRQGQSLNGMWNRRHTTKFNGVPYVVQRGAEAVYSEEGMQQVRQTIAFYQENARVIREGLKEAGLEVYGGVNSPYIWFKTPTDSWSFFDRLLKEAHVVTTPGAGFGPSGEGYIRVTAFGDAEDTKEAVRRILDLLK